MPTATDDKVFIRWTKSAFEATEDPTIYNVAVDVILFIDGVQVASVKHFQWTTSVPFDTVLTERLEDKRLDYVSA